MSSSTQNTTSDNKQKEDCRCSSGGGAAVLGAPGGGSALNSFEHNSNKKQISTSSGNLQAGGDFKTNKFNEDASGGHSGGIDSGVISGPLSSCEQDDDDYDDDYFGGKQQQPFNITGAAPEAAPTQPFASEKEEPIYDSGCIEYKEDDETPLQLQDHSFEPTASDMLLKNNVDANISERFVSLSLQTSNASAGGTISINNLASSGNRTAAYENQLSAKSATIPSASVLEDKGTTPPNLTPWEQYYQQNEEGDTYLHLACISNYENVVAALIRLAPHPCLFNIQNDEAKTPLHFATITSQPRILRMLLLAGAEPTIRDCQGNTALHLACISGDEQCVRALTTKFSASEINEAHRNYGHRSKDTNDHMSYLNFARLPADLEIRNYDGERCVHLAAQGGHINIIHILVQNGADINAREGRSGYTPLHMAIINNNEELINFILDDCQKLNLETETYAGLTAYQLAQILQREQILSTLAKRGANPLTPPDSDYSDSETESDLEDAKTISFGDRSFFVKQNGANAMTVA